MHRLISVRFVLFTASIAVILLWFVPSADCGDNLPPDFRLQSEKIELPVSDKLFPGGSEADAANAYCLICHSRGMVDIQPPMPRAVWKAEINKMRDVFGCPVPQELVDQLAAFFERINNTPTGGRVAADAPRSAH